MILLCVLGLDVVLGGALCFGLCFGFGEVVWGLGFQEGWFIWWLETSGESIRWGSGCEVWG